MIYTLLFLLLILAIFYYHIFGKDILSPSFIATVMFSISTLFACINANEWGVKFNSHTLIAILSTLICFGIGEIIVRLMCYNRVRKGLEINKKDYCKIDLRKIKIITVFSILFLLFYFYATLNIAKLAGYNGNGKLLFFARQARVHLEDIYGVPFYERLASWLSSLLYIIAYIVSFFLLKDFFQKKCVKKEYLIIIFVYFIFIFLSTRRNDFIYIITFYVLVGSCFYMQARKWNPKYNWKIILFAFLGICIFLLLFIIAGSFKSYDILSRIWKTITSYAGQSIPLLDNYFTYPRPKDEWFGENTLFGIYRFLRKFSSSIPYFFAPYEASYFSNGDWGNVYTMIRRYHEDFGYIGLYGMSIFLGFFYSFWYLKVKRKKDWQLLLYAMCFFPIVEIAIEERFFMYLVDFGRIIILFLTILFYLYLTGKFNKTINIFFRYNEEK